MFYSQFFPSDTEEALTVKEKRKEDELQTASADGQYRSKSSHIGLRIYVVYRWIIH